MTKHTEIIYVITDKNGNTQDANGNEYGWFLPGEEEKAREYAEKNGLDYQKKEEVFVKY